ncbi:MAG: serine/threonine-protein kinase [Bythopirellula sp.]|nr:serine/threonine-protein kinase [Bythopirellula sp.]
MAESSLPTPRRNLPFLPTSATFKLLEPLGVGTVGVVYRAESSDISEPVAIKLLHPNISHDENIVNRFQREIAIMERLNHPHIVRNYGGGIMDGQYFYAMQLLEHGNLKQRIQKNGPLTWQQTAACAAQVASALQHAHNHGIIHRDLKTSNLFFDQSGKLLLGDFGIARDTHQADITDTGITVGTYAYMSPEQICGDKAITGQADLYSLGCVMVEMLTGKPPFAGANFAQVWTQHLNEKPKSLRQQGVDCPEWLDEIVLQLLEKDPSKRPFNARMVQGYLNDHLMDEYGTDLSQFTQYVPPLEDQVTDEPSTKRLMIVMVVLAALVAGVAILGG